MPNLAISFCGFPFATNHDASEGTTRPKKRKTTGSNDLFRARLDQIINLKHELVLLACKIDWDWIDRAALQRERPAGDRDPLHDRAVVAQAHLRAVR